MSKVRPRPPHSLHYLLPPPTPASQHYNLRCTSTHNRQYQHAQATSPTASSSHAYCTKIVTELLSQRPHLLYFTRRIYIVTAVRLVIVDFKEINEWMRSFYHIIPEKWFVLFCMCHFIALTRCCKLISFLYLTRNMGQSPTWGRPAPQVQLEVQFRGCRVCKYLRGQHPIKAEI